MKTEIFEKAYKTVNDLGQCVRTIDLIKQVREYICKKDRGVVLDLHFKNVHVQLPDSYITVDDELREQIINVALSYYEEKKKILKTEFEAL